VFCDSLEELHALCHSSRSAPLPAEIVGPRLRLQPQGIASRFGIVLEADADVEGLATPLRQLPANTSLGIHFHMASNTIGVQAWWELYEALLTACRAIEAASQRQIYCLDIGGGWFPDDWAMELEPQFTERIVARLRRALPAVRELVLEPGRALAQPSMAIAMRVLEVRRRHGRISEVVVDGSIAELAYHNYSNFPHRILWQDGATRRWGELERGQGAILGRLCMEKDILAEAIDLPETIATGDLLVVCDAGAYDRSMSYSFGKG
jgi:diaminopimelate decarboxylase/aspartate kinase